MVTFSRLKKLHEKEQSKENIFIWGVAESKCHKRTRNYKTDWFSSWSKQWKGWCKESICTSFIRWISEWCLMKSNRNFLMDFIIFILCVSVFEACMKVNCVCVGWYIHAFINEHHLLTTRNGVSKENEKYFQQI